MRRRRRTRSLWHACLLWHHSAQCWLRGCRKLWHYSTASKDISRRNGHGALSKAGTVFASWGQQNINRADHTHTHTKGRRRVIFFCPRTSQKADALLQAETKAHQVCKQTKHTSRCSHCQKGYKVYRAEEEGMCVDFQCRPHRRVGPVH